MILEAFDLMTNGGLGDVQLIGRAREAQMPGRRFKGSLGNRRGKISTHDSATHYSD